MDIQEATQLALEQENILSDSDVANIKSKLGKSRCSEKDWAYIRELLRNKHLLTIHPMDKKQLGRFCTEGVLQDKGGALMVFTNLEECVEYGKRYAAAWLGRSFHIDTIPFENVLEIAADYGKSVYIDVRYGSDERFLVYEGKTKTLHLCIDQRMR